MKQKLKMLYPDWVRDTENEFTLCITDDIDSLFASAILRKHIKGEIGFFYNFKQLHKAQTLYKFNKENVITIDCALEGERKCWDNHVTLPSNSDKPNKNSANVNNLLKISRENYFSKYCMGTHLQVISYYDALDYRTLSDEQKLILWAIDASYKGYYSKYQNDRQTHIKYVELLELGELAEVLERYKMNDLIEVMKEYKLDGKITVDSDGFLQTDIKLDKLQALFPQFNMHLPSQKFKGTVILKPQFYQLNETDTYSKDDFKKVFSLALTGKNKVSYTIY